MPPALAIIVPTRERPGYLDVALTSIAPQAKEIGAEILVVDDGPSPQTRAVALRHGARYIAHDAPRSLNAARNTAIDATAAPLLVFVDDDVAVRPGWLAALAEGAERLPEDVGVLTGPIVPRIEDHRFRACGREGGPVTGQDFGSAEADCPHAWGANMAIRRSAIERVGRFDEARELYGDEQEWQARWKAAGGRIRYLPGAALDHRRAGDDARLRALCRAARARGQASRRFDEFKGTAPPLRAELRTLAGCALHGPRRWCAMGPVMTAHSLGRVEALLDPPVAPGVGEGDDAFTSGTSGVVGGVRGALLRARDRWLDAAEAHSGRRGRLTRLARTAPPRRRVLVLAVERTDVPSLLPAARAELARSRHDVRLRVTAPGPRGKFQNLNALLAAEDLGEFDWVLALDDDVALPRGFLDRFLCVAEEAGLQLAQPAHRLHSHAAWAVTYRVPGARWHETTFVEIGPVTAFRRETFDALLPFPDLRMGWGLDAHWAAVARECGWRVGVVDATPVGHTLRPPAVAYGRDAALAEGRDFLASRPHLRREEVRTLEVHR